MEVLLACEGDGLKVADRILPSIFWGLQISAGTGLPSEPIGWDGLHVHLALLHYFDLDAPLTAVHFSTSPRLHDCTTPLMSQHPAKDNTMLPPVSHYIFSRDDSVV
jgi:hypothetical protein